VGMGLGTPVPGAVSLGAVLLLLLFGTGPGAFSATLTSATGGGTAALLAGWKDGVGLGALLPGAGQLSLGALLSGTGAGTFSANLASTTGRATEEGVVGMGLGIPALGAGALPLGASLLGAGNFASFGGGGRTADGSVGMGFGIPVPRRSNTFGLVVWDWTRSVRCRFNIHNGWGKSRVVDVAASRKRTILSWSQIMSGRCRSRGGNRTWRNVRRWRAAIGGGGEDWPGRWTSTEFPCPLSLVGLSWGTPFPGGGGKEEGRLGLCISTGPPGPLWPVGLG